MKRNFITKLTAILMMLLLVTVYPVSAAAASTLRNSAIVYVPDMNSIALYEITPDVGFKIGKETLVFSTSSEQFTDAISGIIGGAMAAALDANAGAAKISAAINRMFSNIQMNKYGRSENTEIAPLTYQTPM